MAGILKNRYFILILVLLLLNARVLVVYADDPENIAIIKTIVNTLDLDNGPAEVKHYLDSCVASEKISIQGFSAYEYGCSAPILVDAPRKCITFGSMSPRAPPPDSAVPLRNLSTEYVTS